MSIINTELNFKFIKPMFFAGLRLSTSSVNFYFPIRTYISCNEPWEKNFYLDKKRFFFMNLERPENPIFLRSTRAADDMIDMLRVVT